MFTANSMNCLMEVLGLAFPGNGSILAVDPARLELVSKAGEAIVKLVENDLKPRDIVNKNSIRNAFILDMAMGGSTNTVLHTIAAAIEADLDFDLIELNKLSKKTPYLCKVSLAIPDVHMEDVHNAGGISAILKELSKINNLLDLNRPTITMNTLEYNIKDSINKNTNIIRSVKNPFSNEGGLAGIIWKYCSEGSIVKTGAVSSKIFKHQGPGKDL